MAKATENNPLSELLPDINVPRGTLEKIEGYVAMLRKWNSVLNLVGKSTLEDVWQRHIADALQLYPLIPKGAEHLIDMGSGGGIPGIILAFMGIPKVTLIESDQRKAAFLKEAARATASQNISVMPYRIETITAADLPYGAADVVTARALAPLSELINYARPFLKPTGECLFMKGKLAESEIAAARLRWTFRVSRIASRTDPEGMILKISEIAHARK